MQASDDAPASRFTATWAQRSPPWDSCHHVVPCAPMDRRWARAGGAPNIDVAG
eukprot:gene51554-39767_t